MSADITQDETIRTVVVYDPDSEELRMIVARTVARSKLELSPDLWAFLDCQRINYNKVQVRFQLL